MPRTDGPFAQPRLATMPQVALAAAVTALLCTGTLITAATPVAEREDSSGSPAVDWREAEAGILENHVQLTFPDRFIKAGEAYFSRDNERIIFQAIEKPDDPDAEPDDFYAMFVADVIRDRSGSITGLDGIRRISPDGSANTCGWFDPDDPDVVIFGSTVHPPEDQDPPGYRRGTRRYQWMFPPEMNIYRVHLDDADGSPQSLVHLAGRDSAYAAECAMSADGRHMVFCSLESGRGDLFVMDMEDESITQIIEAEGYDGGPFFSPDGKRLCYRSDRAGNNLLQLYVAELEFDEDGSIVGVEREFQLTDNEHVNWAPYWHPDGRHLAYATSEVSHRQYEVFLIDADPGNLEDSSGPTRYGTNKRRITHSTGFDGLPVFDWDGEVMMWTSQRGEGGSSQIWVADFVLDLDAPKQPVRPGSQSR